MKRYQVKPVVIEATQIQPSDFTKGPNDNHVSGVKYDPCRQIARLSFCEWAPAGSWIIRLYDGSLQFRNNEEFHVVYEES